MWLIKFTRIQIQILPNCSTFGAATTTNRTEFAGKQARAGTKRHHWECLDESQTVSIRRSRHWTVSTRMCPRLLQLTSWPILALYEISQLLNTQLDKETLATCVGMIESGVNPEALAVRRDLMLRKNL
ncbi:hypothetical protein AcW1_006641 [Taiwanofungus camphoratus]|nr:hypothetical protein AcW1_006641 [Antrodia cinnamomea]